MLSLNITLLTWIRNRKKTGAAALKQAAAKHIIRFKQSIAKAGRV